MAYGYVKSYNWLVLEPLNVVFSMASDDVESVGLFLYCAEIKEQDLDPL